MRIEWLWLARDAIRHPDGSVDATGIFAAIRSTEFPFQLPAWKLAFRAHILPVEQGRELDLELRVIDADGTPVSWSKHGLEVPLAPDPGSITYTFILPIDWMGFVEPGTHSLQMLVDGVTAAMTELTVARSQDRPQWDLDRPPMRGLD